ncbi:MAG: hypothetical protein AUI14_24130 [Actinobacteria bacterium 13_2_20CM_2_71_6]|nr:MAG: hypothetical protein AUI14_24130 [Actinobacteria bacterium 13_2_20CM_2_71_6]
MTVRPPQDVDILQPGAGASIDLAAFTTTFADTLRSLRTAGHRTDMVNAATAFINSAAFIDSPRKIDKPYLDFMLALRALTDQTFWTGAGTAFKSAFGNAEASAVVKTDAFIAFYSHTADSIVAATIEPSVSPKVRALLTTTIRALWLIRRLAGSAKLSRSVFLSAPLVLPPGIFPLPPVEAALGGLRKAAALERKAKVEARSQRLAQLSADLTAHRHAVDELLTAFEQAGTQTTGNGRSVGFALPDEAAAKLTESTKGVLTANGLVGTGFDVAKTVALLENRSATLAKSLYADASAVRQLVRIGNTLVTRESLVDGALVNADPNDRTPGPCPPAADVAIPQDAATVPTGHGEAKILGIADLNLVEQQLLRHELGEIAHIENVLKSETRSRTFKTSDTTEQTVTTETETTQVKEQDLSSSERFELQSESQTVINENASRDGGLTIHASYGPSVDATSNFNFSSSSSRQQSNTASASYAREVATKAVNRVQTRTLTRRTTTTINVVEETNQHSFDNKAGSNDIVGVYRFVDKVYRTQVVNYGKRLMLEFIVPEPAAFLRHAMTKHYLFWASKYGAQDVTAPPPSIFLASGAKKSPDSMKTIQDGGERNINSDLLDVAIPDGYLAQSAFVNIFGETQAGKHVLTFQVQDQQGTYIEPVDDHTVFALRLLPSPTVTVSINSIGFHNYEVVALVFCTLSAEKYQEWQLKTFNSVMTAYQDEKSRFDQAVAEARLRARSNNVVGGTNPAINRETEQTELKKGCISLLTGQRFDLFDAVARNVAPLGFPEIDFAEAKAEGPYIQVFEQSFEWNNMTYLFYPYFWGKKDEWPTVSQLTDDDPLFTRFLRAGAARVQVPVRLGFEQSILTYLGVGELWPGEGTLVNSDGISPDPLHLSIVDELKSQLGDNNVDGPGTLSVSKNSVNVTGNGTAFSTDDEDRRIDIAGKTYVIRTVVDEQTIKLAANYTGDNDSGVGYSMGGKLIGEPWEVKLPTNLVKIDNNVVFS